MTLYILTYSYTLYVAEEMDGVALAMALASSPGPDCLKDVVPRLGIRLKVYQAIKLALESEVR